MYSQKMLDGVPANANGGGTYLQVAKFQRVSGGSGTMKAIIQPSASPGAGAAGLTVQLWVAQAPSLVVNALPYVLFTFDQSLTWTNSAGNFHYMHEFDCVYPYVALTVVQDSDSTQTLDGWFVI